ncbi:MAG TPA: 4Fe-4S dicluster domain-containing protein [Intrasporangium sp.]|uniref:4Fe-4S dicluster domain-containing protein n=1 Tax=Intrasporangium sp. TaxID=1925024 RepID=UPI002D78409A|nr:4Fe-4S dicluster domain-containing protein [Intrasporangium sp.]HET7398107.1 4Fe-4S dicluster domain-containing protein [Intrasporangium sp.]
MGFWSNQLAGPTDPAADAAWDRQEPRKGFFTDTSICIGCKACEVACKEWNAIPEDGLQLLGTSYDNTGSLGASTWRHVAFIEQTSERIAAARESGRRLVDLGMPSLRTAEVAAPVPAGMDPVADRAAAVAQADAAQALGTVPDFRWLMASDVCKHCTHAACLDVCPTGALFRTEFGTVVVQDDVCNGCGYCVAACPFGVIERRAGEPTVKNVGVAQKCTLCYDRIGDGQTPACAQACPTTSIKFGDLDEMRDLASERVQTLHGNGYPEARLYGADPNDGVGGTGSVFLLLDEPEVYGLPPDPRVTTADLPDMFRRAGFAGVAMLAMAAVSFLGRRR